jgi:hypothetical protein
MEGMQTPYANHFLFAPANCVQTHRALNKPTQNMAID